MRGMQMIKIHYGRENLDKNKFIFDNVKKDSGEVILLVPEQYTLQAEKEAFFYLEAKGMMSIQVMSLSGLARKVLRETGGSAYPMIDKRGRHMLITKILSDEADKLTLYGNYSSAMSFVEMTNNFISEIKQHDVSPERLAQIAEGRGRFLERKLADMEVIYRAYEKHIEGKYIDTEDRVDLFTDKIGESDFMRGKTFWVYGFDYFTPKNLKVIEAIAKAAPEVNIVLTCGEGGDDEEIFAIGSEMMEKLKALSADTSIHAIGDAYVRDMKPALAALERSLFAMPFEESSESEGVTLVRAGNLYSEAETAAVKVLGLLREREMKLKDIVIICNDVDVRGSIYKRVFASYGIDLFLDKKRDVLHTPLVTYILALLNVLLGYKREDVFGMLKTGLTDIAPSDLEELENYADMYDVRGSKWKEPFEWKDKSTEKMEALRQEIIEPMLKLGEEFKADKRVSARVFVLYKYLKDVAKIPEKLKLLISEQMQSQDAEGAEETAQIWNVALEILDQMVEILPEEKISAKDFAKLIRAGFEAEEVGLLPPTADGLILGTMQRTRSGNPRALLVMGANEGLLPADKHSESILTEDEKEILKKENIEICKTESIRVMEETLAIYKTFAKAGEEIWVSCSACDEAGEKINPSNIFNKLREIFPDIEVQGDVTQNADSLDLVGSEAAALEHLIDAIKSGGDDALADIWQEVLAWFQRNDPGFLASAEAGFAFDNKTEKLGREVTGKLYKGEDMKEYVLSPSALELYGACPFKYMIRYGLDPDEQLPYSVNVMDMGTLYHSCMESVAKELTGEGVEVSDENSKWNTVRSEELDRMVEDIVDERASEYREGLMQAQKINKYRLERMKEVCKMSVRAMVNHVRLGRIVSVESEVTFADGAKLKPLKVTDEILIRGKIDRVDMLPGKRVKIIDYKSGLSKYDRESALRGLKLQLFIYLKAVMGSNEDAKPGGAFYFHVREPLIEKQDMSEEDMPEKIRKQYVMDGVMVNTDEMIKAVDRELEAGGSEAAPLSINKSGEVKKSDKVLSEEDFDALMKEVDAKIIKMCEEIASGDVTLKPAYIKGRASGVCSYCEYRGICKFDMTFDGCNYNYK